MAVLTREELLNRIKDRLPDELSDDDVLYMEDIVDTFDEAVNRSKDMEDWKQKYQQLDEEWKRRYIERFTAKQETFIEEPDAKTVEDEVINQPMTYDELFS